MYSKNITTVALLLCCQFLLGYTGEKGLKEFKEVIEKTTEFSMNDPHVYLSNRYGNIDVTTTSGTTVTFVATIIVEAENDNRAADIIDRIDINLRTNTNSFNAVTSIENNDGWNITKRSESYTIHYAISIPKSSSLDISNKHGDISIADLDNDLNLELKHGSGQVKDINGDIDMQIEHVNKLELGNVSGDASLEIAHSKFSMQNVGDVDLEAKHSEVELNNTNQIVAETKHTNITINEVESLYIEGKYDEISIDKVEHINVNAKFDKVKIGTLGKMALLYTEHGKVTIDEVDSDFKEIEIKGEHAGYDFRLLGGYSIDISGKHASASYPNEVQVTYRDKEKNELELKGNMPGTGNGKIVATMKHSKVRLRD